MNLTKRERLERMPLQYSLVVYAGRRVVYRTVAVGEWTQVQEDAHRLARAMGGANVDVTRLKQQTPPPPVGAPKWWAIGEPIDAGTTYNLAVSPSAPGESAWPADAELQT